MEKWNYQITDRQGLHVRPIARIVVLLMQYQCQVRIACREGSADGKDLMALMNLGAGTGEVLTFCFEGEDEKNASGEMKQLLTEIGL